MNTNSRSAQIRALRIRILQESLKWLRAAPNEDKEMRVCGAIDQAHRELLPAARSQWGRDMLRHAVDGLLCTITERLGTCDSVHLWVRAMVYGEEELLASEIARFAEDHPDMIAYRRAWVEDMIRTLQNGGDL